MIALESDETPSASARRGRPPSPRNIERIEPNEVRVLADLFGTGDHVLRHRRLLVVPMLSLVAVFTDS